MINTVNWVTIIFPAYNEENSIFDTLKEYRVFFPEAFFVVVDNNSKDETLNNAEKYFISSKTKGIVLKEPIQGKANAVKQAIKRYKSLWWILTDADLTYPAEDMRFLFDEVRRKRIDHGILDRMSSNSYVNKNSLKTKVHKIGNIFFSRLISIASGVKFSDVLSGGRVFSSPFVEMLEINCGGFELESEINFHSVEINASTIEFPCKYRKRNDGDPSKLSPFRDGIKILKFIFDWGIKKKPDMLFNASGIILVFIGSFLSIKLIELYITIGKVTFPSTAVAASLLLLSGIQFLLFGLSSRLQRESHIKNLRIMTNQLRKNWHQDLDSNDI